jgi:hypothetical protein
MTCFFLLLLLVLRLLLFFLACLFLPSRVGQASTVLSDPFSF